MTEWPQIPSAILPAEREWLKAQAAKLAGLGKGAMIVHIGVAGGMSLYCSRVGAPEATIVGVDLDVGKCSPQVDVDYFIEGNSHLVHRSWVQPIDFLFIDGDHSMPAVLADILSWLPFVVGGGVVAFHDYGNRHLAWCRGVSEAVDAWDWTDWQEIPAAGSIKAYRKDEDDSGENSD